MSSSASFVKNLLFATLIPAVTLLAVFYLLLAMVGLAWTGCITEVRGRTSGVSGFDFEVRETNCDTLAKTETISVFASKSGQAKETLLIKYYPIYQVPMPVITSVDQHTVQISIPRISSLFFRRDGFKGLVINYKIDVIDYLDSEIEKE